MFKSVVLGALLFQGLAAHAAGVPASLRESIPNLKPGGRLVDCTDSTGIAETLFGETQDGNYLLALRELYYINPGALLGVLFASGLDDDFVARSAGNYLQLTAAFPESIPNPPAGPFPTCQFSATARDVIACELNTSGRVPMTIQLTDGVSTKVESDTEADFSIENVTTVSVGGENQSAVFALTLYNASHPFPNGYVINTPFDPRSCVAEETALTTR